MKRFLVFCCEHYYPSGGWDDLDEAFDTLEEAHYYIDKMPKSPRETVYIVDLETMEKL